MTTLILKDGFATIDSNPVISIPLTTKFLSPVKVDFSRLQYDTPSSLRSFFERMRQRDLAVTCMLSFLTIFSGPLLITSFIRGTGTHTGEALDFKPVLSQDAHEMKLSPIYNTRPDLIRMLTTHDDYIKSLNLVLLIEENHVHIHYVSPRLASILAPGVYVKPIYSRAYQNDPYTQSLIQLVEGHEGGQIITAQRWLELNPDIKFQKRF